LARVMLTHIASARENILPSDHTPQRVTHEIPRRCTIHERASGRLSRPGELGDKQRDT